MTYRLLPGLWKGLLTTSVPLRGIPTTSRPPGWSPDQFRTFGRVSRAVPDLLEGLPTSSGNPGGCTDHIRNSGREFRPLLDLREGLSTNSGTLGGSSYYSRNC